MPWLNDVKLVLPDRVLPCAHLRIEDGKIAEIIEPDGAWARRQAAGGPPQPQPPARAQQGFIPNPKLRFLDQCREVLRFHHYARRTEAA